MAQYSRTVKYKKLRDEIAMDNEAHINPRSRDLERYADRISTIEPGILPQSPTSEFDSALKHLNEVIERTLDKDLPPISSEPAAQPANQTAEVFPSARTPSAGPEKPIDPTVQLFPSANKKQPLRPYMPEEGMDEQARPVKKQPSIRPFMVEELPEERPKPAKKQPVQNPYISDEEKTERIQRNLFAEPDTSFSKRPQDTPAEQRSISAEEIRNEVEQLLREKDPEEYDTDSFIHETRELQRELDAHADEIDGFQTKMKETHKLINIILWAVILALAVVLAVIIYFIIRP